MCFWEILVVDGVIPPDSHLLLLLNTAINISLVIQFQGREFKIGVLKSSSSIKISCSVSLIVVGIYGINKSCSNNFDSSYNNYVDFPGLKIC